jgi:uncharacterized protein (TIGR02231 family)
MTNLINSIVAVSVYPDRARITRRGSLPLEVGAHCIAITELPIHLNPDSVRLSAHGTARARLSGVQLSRLFYVETPSETVHTLELEIEQIQDEIKRLDAQAELVKQERVNLDKLSAQAQIFATALAVGEMTIEQQLSLVAGLRSQAEKLDHEAQAIQVSRRDNDRRLQKLSKELEQLRTARPPERYTASVEVDVTQAGELTIELSYLVNQAGWVPLYDLCLLEQEGKPELELGYLAQVTQDTGEAWEGISLTLSTARPAMSSVLPELDPWYISQRRPIIPLPRMAAVPQKLAYARMEAPAVESETAGDFAQADLVAEEVTSIVDTTTTSITYTIPGTTTIPPDGAMHKVTIARYPLTPRLDYVSAPRLAEAAYRRAKLVNDSIYTLLPGEANIFIGDEYIGTTQLKLTTPQGEIEIYLGVEDRLTVTRELKRRDIDKRFIGGKRHYEFGYEIKLENLLPGKVDLTVQDQIPVSRHEEIKVKLELANPKPAEQTELNLLKWELILEPKVKRTLRFDFSVESPQAMEIIGLP